MTKNSHRPSATGSLFSRCCHILLLTAALASTPLSAAEALCRRPVADAIPLLESMEASWDRVSDYTAQLLKTERFVDGTTIAERGSITFRKPNQLHFRLLEGTNAGAELIFPKPGTDNVVLARPGGISGALAGFLIKVPGIGSLIPYEFALDDARLMAGQHHPPPASTIANMLRLIAVNLRAAAMRQEGAMCFHPGEAVDGNPAIKIEVRLPADVGIWHTVADGESVKTISSDYGQDPYSVFYNNPLIHAKDALSAGDRLFVPRYYAPRALLWVSEEFNLPVKLHIFDVENRLYEAYTNAELRVDVGLGDEHFDPALHGFPEAPASSRAPSDDR